MQRVPLNGAQPPVDPLEGGCSSFVTPRKTPAKEWRILELKVINETTEGGHRSPINVAIVFIPRFKD
jgi:hypothetical protein